SMIDSAIAQAQARTERALHEEQRLWPQERQPGPVPQWQGSAAPAEECGTPPNGAPRDRGNGLESPPVGSSDSLIDQIRLTVADDAGHWRQPVAPTAAAHD